MLSEDVQVSGSDGLNGVQGFLTIWERMFIPTFLHVWHLIDSFVGLKGLIKLITWLLELSSVMSPAETPGFYLILFFLAVATGLTHLQQFVFPLPGSSHLLCSHSYATTWIFLIFIC